MVKMVEGRLSGQVGLAKALGGGDARASPRRAGDAGRLDGESALTHDEQHMSHEEFQTFQALPRDARVQHVEHLLASSQGHERTIAQILASSSLVGDVDCVWGLDIVLRYAMALKVLDSENPDAVALAWIARWKRFHPELVEKSKLDWSVLWGRLRSKCNGLTSQSQVTLQIETAFLQSWTPSENCIADFLDLCEIMPLSCLHLAIRICVLAVSSAGEAEEAKLMLQEFSDFLEVMMRRSFAIQEWQLDMCESENARQRIEGYRLFLYYPRDAELDGNARALRLIREGLVSRDAEIRGFLVVGMVGLFLPGLEVLGGHWLRQLRIMEGERSGVVAESVEVTYGWYGWALGQCQDVDLGAELADSQGFVRRCVLSGLAGVNSRYMSVIGSLLDSSSMDREVLVSEMMEFAEGDYSPHWDREGRMRQFGPVLLLLIRAMRGEPEPGSEVTRRLLDLMEEILSEEIGGTSQ